MNREIKFRAWNKKEKYMEPVDDLQMFSNQLSIGMLSKDYFLGKDDVELMQYTGLHDKNGKEIYEGDILRIIVNNNIEKICAVEFKNGIFGVMFSKQRELTAFPHFYNTTFEIIGNIYDNPELLGGEDEC